MPTPISLQPGNIGLSCYPTGPGGPQALNVAIVNAIQAQLPDAYPGVAVGFAPPPADQRDRPWFNLANLKWYYFQNGNWWRAADTTAGPDQSRMWWVGSESDLWSFQGGDGSNPATVTPTAYKGSLWQRDAALDGTFPLQAGTLPDQLVTGVPVVVAVGDPNGGHNAATLALENVPNHWHQVASTTIDTLVPSSSNYLSEHRADGNYAFDATNSVANVLRTSGAGGDPAATPANATRPFASLPPYHVGFWAMRTIRQWVQ